MTAFPHIWTPPKHLGVEGLARLMAHLKKGSGGHLLKTSTGHLAKSCGETFPCIHCGGIPETISITFSGLSVCTTCLSGSGISQENIDLVAWNGAFDLTFDPLSGSTCRWNLTTAFEGGSFRQCNTTGCTGSVVRTSTMDELFIQVGLSASSQDQTRLLISAALRGMSDDNFFADCGNFTYDSQNHEPGGLVCDDINGGTFDNNATCAIPSILSPDFITGGDATITWVT